MADQTSPPADPTANGAGGIATMRRGAPGPQGAKLAKDLRLTVERNAKLNLWVRSLLAALGLGAGAAAVVCTLRHGAELATLVDAESTADLGRRLLALTMPVILLVALAGIAAATRGRPIRAASTSSSARSTASTASSARARSRCPRAG